MPLQLSKWGNSLAIRLPAALTRQAGWQVNDQVDARLTPTGELVLVPVPHVPSTSVRGGLGLLAGKTDRVSPPLDSVSEEDAKLLRAVRDDDRQTHG